MPQFGVGLANDLAYAALDWYLKGETFKQTIQKKPLLRILNNNKKTFSGGAGFISIPVQGDFMVANGANNGFIVGFSNDDAVTFSQAQNMLRVKYPWKEMHAGLMLNWTELKIDGITITDNQKEHYHGGRDKHVLIDILKNRMADFGESYSRALNYIYWSDGSQDAKVMPGLKSILTDVANAGTVGGLSRATYSWWRHYSFVGANAITSSTVDSTLIKALRRHFIQLVRYGGSPKHGICGSDFIEALRNEIDAKGIYTQSGFAKKTNIGFGEIEIDGVTFEYDPTLDTLGESKRCYLIDPKHIKLRPMEGEDNKTLKPTRPYNYMVYLHSVTTTGVLTADQLNCHEILEIK